MDRTYILAAGAIIVLLGLFHALRRGFDPFAPIWWFLAGFLQIYVVQPLSYREYALRARGPIVVEAASLRVLWALAWFLAVYYSGLGKRLARQLPAAPARWSPALAVGLAPPLIVWGLVCSGLMLRGAGSESPEGSLLMQFPTLMLVGGTMLLVTGRQPDRPRPVLTVAGLAIHAAYLMIWMFNGKRSHSMIAVLTGTCAFYLPRFRRPSMPVLGALGVVCALVVSLALGWRGNNRYEQSLGGFLEYVSNFEVKRVLVNANLAERDEEAVALEGGQPSKETEEWGGFLLIFDTVPAKSRHDYGASYLRMISTFIPRVIWKDKPLFGRDQWIAAWQAGSEQPREENFTGPSIGLLGAAHLNGGAVGTLIVLAVVALVIRTAYDYYRYHADRPWAQVWWTLTFYNAWMMVATDDPFVFFYYMYGYSILPPMLFLWAANRLGGAAPGHSAPVVALGAAC